MNALRKTEQKLASRYAQSLREFLDGAGETALQQAYELGREAMIQGVGVLDLVAIHEEAARTAVRNTKSRENPVKQTKTAYAFLMESLSPFEMTHRSFREANDALHRLNETLEEETRRIAHMVHDDATQLLAVVHIALADLADDLPAAMGARVQEIRGHLDLIEAQLRRISHELRPTVLDDLGLMPALEFLAERKTKRTGLAIVIEGSTNGRLASSIETTLYRIVQEALVNAAKHAHASRAMVHVTREPYSIHCAIRDNGDGFNVRETQARKSQRGLGLIVIGERLKAVGGTLQINSSAQRGTEMLVSIPLES
jgi:signal transduction histidine kinase